MSDQTGLAPVNPNTITEEKLLNWFSYHAPSAEDTAAYQTIRKAALDLARVIVRETPTGPDQTVAIRKLRETVYSANAARACGGK